MKVIHSNSLEILLVHFLEEISSSPASVFSPENVITPCRAMDRWLQLRISQTFGIAAHFHFQSIEEFIPLFMEELHHQKPKMEWFQKGNLLWYFYFLLLKKREDAQLKTLLSFLEEEPTPFSYYLLSKQLATSFERYCIYRTDVLRRWEKKMDPLEWQSTFWTELLDIVGQESLHHWVDKSIWAWEESKPASLPERIFLFGFTQLPFAYFDFFHSLSDKIPVTLFLLNPCREFWGDLVSPKWLLHKKPQKELYYDVGHPLLSSLGRHSQIFIESMFSYSIQDEDSFSENLNPSSLLSHLQNDLFHLKNRSAEKEDVLSLPKDSSIQVHSCHSIVRELEVLYQNLLHCLEQDPLLQLHEISVMAPDISLYAPYIAGIFLRKKGDEKLPNLSFAISEQRKRVEHQICDVFLQIVALASSRFGYASVLDILMNPLIYRKFGLREEDLPLIQKWVQKVEIRWGIDGTHKQQFQVPPSEENTWLSGIQRLLLGVSMAANDEFLVEGILPYDPIEGRFTSVLGKWLDFLERLFVVCSSLLQEKTLQKWGIFLSEMLEHFFLEEEKSHNSFHYLRENFYQLQTLSFELETKDSIELVVIEDWLREVLKETKDPSGFLTGSISFSNLKTMSKLPAKVVCLLGMNDKDFPRSSFYPDFDLLKKNPLPNDPSERNEDKQYFLEALISARNTLYISYIGQDLFSPMILPPSPVVLELQETLEKSYMFETEKGFQNPLHSICFKHPLNSFSKKYFSKGTGLFTYSKEDEKSFQQLLQERQSIGLLSKNMSFFPRQETKDISLESLFSFYKAPVKFFLSEVLGLSLFSPQEPREEKEPFEWNSLETYWVQYWLAQRDFSHISLEKTLKIAKATGLWPHGKFAEQYFFKSYYEVKKYLEQVASEKGNLPEQVVEIECKVGSSRIVGEIRNLYGNRLVENRMGSIKGHHRLNQWISALLLHSFSSSYSTVYIGNSNIVTMTESSLDSKHLSKLVDIYNRGQQEALPLFPSSSYDFAERMLKSKGKSSPFELENRVKKEVWFSDWGGEPHTQWNDLAFGQKEPFGERFRTLALDVYVPLLEVQKNSKWGEK